MGLGTPDIVNGWVLRCPDGTVRHPPYFNRGDADFDAGHLDSHLKCACHERGHRVRNQQFRPPEVA